MIDDENMIPFRDIVVVLQPRQQRRRKEKEEGRFDVCDRLCL